MTLAVDPHRVDHSRTTTYDALESDPGCSARAKSALKPLVCSLMANDAGGSEPGLQAAR
jgi:hypothetical protein